MNTRRYNKPVARERRWHTMLHPAEPLTNSLPPASFLSFPRRSTQLPGITRASSSFAVTQMELWPYGTSEARANPYRQSPHTVRSWSHTHTHTNTHSYTNTGVCHDNYNLIRSCVASCTTDAARRLHKVLHGGKSGKDELSFYILNSVTRGSWWSGALY